VRELTGWGVDKARKVIDELRAEGIIPEYQRGKKTVLKMPIEV